MSPNFRPGLCIADVTAFADYPITLRTVHLYLDGRLYVHFPVRFAMGNLRH